MSRTVTFEKKSVIDIVMQTFWDKGLKTTLTDIEKATGLNRSSIYNSLGDKDELFRISMICYLEYMEDWVNKSFKNLSFKDFLKSILNDAATENFNGKGCLFYNCLGSMDDISAKTKEVLNSTYINIRGIFEKRIALAQQLNELDPTLNKTAYAALIMATIAGIRAFNLSDFEGQDLEQVVALAFSKLL